MALSILIVDDSALTRKAMGRIIGMLDLEVENAFEALSEDQCPDMLLRFKDWTTTAMEHM